MTNKELLAKRFEQMEKKAQRRRAERDTIEFLELNEECEIVTQTKIDKIEAKLRLEALEDKQIKLRQLDSSLLHDDDKKALEELVLISQGMMNEEVICLVETTKGYIVEVEYFEDYLTFVVEVQEEVEQSDTPRKVAV